MLKLSSKDVLLTFMATLDSLTNQGHLIKIEVGLDPEILPERVIYALPSVVRWLKAELPMLVAEWGRVRSLQSNKSIIVSSNS